MPDPRRGRRGPTDLTDPSMPDPHRGRREGRRENRVRPSGDCFHAHGIYIGNPMAHFDVPTAAGRQIFSIQCCCRNKEATVFPLRGSRQDQLAAVRSDSGPVIVVFVSRDGKYFTDYGFPRIDELVLKVLSSLSRLEVDAQPLEQYASTKLFEQLSITATSSSYNQDTIWLRNEYEWELEFYTRIDRAGFHTYPDVGGPFQSLDEVSSAIDFYLYCHLDPKMRMVSEEDNKCTLEMAIWRHLHWPDGTRKRRLETQPIDKSRCSMHQLVQALVDKYNDDHNLSEDLAYELQRVVHYRYFHDGDTKEIYYHINFTTKIRGFEIRGVDDFDHGIDNLLFFAELVQRGRDELEVSCICRVDPSDARGCYACSRDMYHPKVEKYSGGLSGNCRLGGMFCYDGPEEDSGCTPAELEAEEASVRLMYEGLDPSYFLETPIEEGC